MNKNETMKTYISAGRMHKTSEANDKMHTALFSSFVKKRETSKVSSTLNLVFMWEKIAIYIWCVNDSSIDLIVIYIWMSFFIMQSNWNESWSSDIIEVQLKFPNNKRIHSSELT